MAKTLISTATASSSSSLSFTSGIDSTYDVYEFHFINIHPSVYLAHFTFQVNALYESGFNEVITSTFFKAAHSESDSSYNLLYETGWDQSQGTDLQKLTGVLRDDDDSSSSGVLTLYAPSSSTYIKHWEGRINSVYGGNICTDSQTGGYINNYMPIDEISFQMSTGNIDAGTIKMFGVD